MTTSSARVNGNPHALTRVTCVVNGCGAQYITSARNPRPVCKSCNMEAEAARLDQEARKLEERAEKLRQKAKEKRGS